MKLKSLLAAAIAAALSGGALVAAPQAIAAEPVSVLSLLEPHALDDRTAPDGTPIAVQLPDSDRVIGARPSTTPAAVDLTTTAAGTRYFVDCQAAAGGDGRSVAAPLNSLAAASAIELEPGDELLFKRGTVCEGQLKPKGSGEPGKRISIDAYGDATAMPRLDGKGVESVVRLDNQEHWQIRNLEITNFTNDSRDYTTPRRGIVVALTDFGRGQDYELSDNYIHHVWGQNRKDLGGSGGIQFEAYSSVRPTYRYQPCADPCKPTAFDDIHIHHNIVENVNRSGINVGSNFRSRESVGGSIQDYEFFVWGPMHTHDNIVSNVGGDAIVVQFASGSKVENNTVWDSSNFHGGKSNNGNNAAVWAWDADFVEFRNNHVFQTVMPDGTWDGTAFDADYGTTGTLFEYNLTHQNEGGFMLFCGCGGLSTQTVMRYNISLADGAGAEDHNEGPRLFFQAGQSDAEVYNNTFLLQPNVHLNKGASGATAVVFANNTFLAQGDVRHAAGNPLAEVWRNNVFAGTWGSWPRDGEGNQLAAGLGLLDGSGLERVMVNTQSVIGRGAPIAEEGTVDVLGNPVPHALPPDAGAFQLTSFPGAADVTVVDGGFEDADGPWQGGTRVTADVRSGSAALSLDDETAEQSVRAAINRTYRLTAAVKGDVEVSVTHRSGAVATAEQSGAVDGKGYTPVSTVLRTASDASTLEVAVTGTGLVDDVALTEIEDYVVDGSFESPSNTPWTNQSRSRDAVSGQSALSANAANREVLVPGAGTYELWGWGKSTAGAVTIAASGAGGSGVSLPINSRDYQQARTTFAPTTTIWGGDHARFTVECTVAGATAGLCDDLSVTDVWDGIARSVPSAPTVVMPPTAPADPPAPPRPAQPAWVPFSDITVVGASSAAASGPATNVNDADTSSIWHSSWGASQPPPPHWITLSATDDYVIESLQYTPRQDGNPNGMAKDYRVFGSDSNDNWASATLLASGTMVRSTEPKLVTFDEPTTLKYIRFQIDSAHIKADDPHQYGTAATIRLGFVEETPEPPVVTPLTVNLTVGQPVSIQVVATSENGPLSYAATNLPAGLTVDAETGLITGVPTTAGTFTPTITVTDASGLQGSASAQMVVAAAPEPEDTTPPSIEAVSAASGEVGTPLSIAIRATDESTPLVYSAAGLPAGVSINSATGVISGNPTAAGTFAVTVTVTDAEDNAATVSFTLTVAPKPTVEPTEPEPTEPAPTDPPTFTRTAPYTLPGKHSVGGREWVTTCEPYSQTERCRTDIWASVVKRTGNTYTIERGWAFNNLTYLPFMKREQWSANPLGFTGSWTAADGTLWRTECDTELTGGSACRSFRWTTVYYSAPKATSGYTFGQENKWVFNNLVMFGNYSQQS